MMKSSLKTRSIRDSIMLVAAVSALALPLFASAATKNISVAYDKTELDSTHGQQQLYDRMKNASAKLCGSTSIQITGSLSTVTGNEACYNGTLTAAVERLDNDDITALHFE